MRTPLFENEKVRVWRTVMKPGEPLPVHQHAKPRVAIPLEDFKFKRVFASGKEQEVVFDFGQAYWEGTQPEHDPYEVQVESDGPGKEVIVVEIK